MIRKFLTFAATATLAAGSLAFVAAPVQAAAPTIYTQCTLGNYPFNSGKLTKSNLKKATVISCKDLDDLSALKGATQMTDLLLFGEKKLKVAGTSHLKKLPVKGLHIYSPVSDSKYAFASDFPKLTTLRTGPTKVSSLSNIAKLKNLSMLVLSTSKELSFSTMGSKKKLETVIFDGLSSKAHLNSLAALPKLVSLYIPWAPGQSLTPLKASKSLGYVAVHRYTKKQLKKGQSYKPANPSSKTYGALQPGSSIGWTLPTKTSTPMTSNGTGLAWYRASKASTMGRITIAQTLTYEAYTPGKMNFHAPVVAAKSGKAGATIKAVANKKNASSSGWNGSISSCSYQWQRNTKDISGAKAMSYKVTAADKGKVLRLKTTCNPVLEMKQLYGFTSNTKYSGAVKASS